MARSDLLISLVKAGSTGDRKKLQATTEAIIAEEKAKNHNILAERLTRALRVNGGGHHGTRIPSGGTVRCPEFLLELTPEFTLGDMIMSGPNLRACQDLIEEQRHAPVLRSHSLEPRHRVLLSGPPGNGKTSLAGAIAEALVLPFLVVRYESMIGSYLGETASRLKRVFDYARTTPCVLFFDEFDAIGKERGDEHETGEIKRVVTSLLMQMDDLPSHTVVVAATNHGELLDRAIWRRFQLRLTLKPPTRSDMTAHFERFAKTFDQPLGKTPETIAKSLGKVSYAEMIEFCLDMRRKYVLSMGSKSLKRILAECLELWANRTTPATR